MKSRMSHVLICNNYNVSVSKRANAYKRYDFIIHFASNIVLNTVKLTNILTDEVTDFHSDRRFLPLVNHFTVIYKKYKVMH